MQKISVNGTNNCDGNQLNHNNDLPAIGNKNYALQKPFETDFLTVIGKAKLRSSFVFCWVGQSSRQRCGPRHPILHSNIFFYVKLFATIILSWNSLKCILWYLLELSDPSHIVQNIAETCQKYFQSFIANEILLQHFCQILKNILSQLYNFNFLKYLWK